MIFRSRSDVWLRVVLWISHLIMLGSIVMLLAHGAADSIVVAVFVAVILAGVLWIQFATYYRIDGSTLIVRSGPMRWNIPIASITSVTPTDDPTSGPALSLRRLRVEYGAKEMLISPADQEAFVAALRNAGWHCAE